MNEPPETDWESPEVGEAIRIILDVFESVALPRDENRRRFLRLVALAEQQPRVLVSAYSAVFHAALDLGGLMPSVDELPKFRQELEKAVYRGIEGMPP